MRNRS